MRLNLTFKRLLGYKRKTIKSGGGKTNRKLSANAKPYIPNTLPYVNDLSSNIDVNINNRKTIRKLSANAKPYIPNMLSNVESNRKLSANAKPYIPNIESYNSINNKSKKNISTFESQLAEIRRKIENAVAIDCEMVGVEPDNKSALAHVAIVDFNGKKIYDKYVIPIGGLKSITNYRTEYSGITPAQLSHLDKKEHSFQTVKREVHNILKDKTIVGHGLINDFNVLDFIPNPDMIWDSTIIDKYLQNHPYIPGKRQPRKLKVISKEYANNNIQQADKTGHSPLEDARASMNLYRLYYSYPKIVYNNMSK